MLEDDLRELLSRVRAGSLEPKEALRKLKDLPFERLGFATLDHHRALRQGHPEAIFCQGKTLEQIRQIAARLMEQGSNILATRATPEVFRALAEMTDDLAYHEAARIVVLKPRAQGLSQGTILVITAGTADIPVAEEAAVTAEAMGHRIERRYDVGVAGIHRLLALRDRMEAAAVIVVVAGMDGALPSVVGGLTDKPVVAVPTSVGYGASLGGVAALLTMLNSCANGVVVVNIDNGFGAGCFAGRILRLAEKEAD
ncbi:MAG: nickel pincer cofactor biosynthesis protein LarB [Spirochaetales bacterium]|nr:nickel pincer cofactor biosynthesis protein LarB [Spirochaetales bacterium]